LITLSLLQSISTLERTKKQCLNVTSNSPLMVLLTTYLPKPC